MQNRKNFLKTVALGVVGAVGLTLIPSKALADKPFRMVYPRLKYFLPIGTMIDIKGLTDFHYINAYAELHDIVSSGIQHELGERTGRIIPFPTYRSDVGYGYAFDFNPYPSTGFTVDFSKINKTMKHIIDGTPDPFMDYPYAD